MKILGVEFERYGELHYLSVAGDADDFRVGDDVLYPTSGGPEVARVVWRGESAAEGFPECLGHASAEDLARDVRNREDRERAKATAIDLIERHGLPMKVLGVDLIDRSEDFDRMYAIYYTAPRRVDFRALVPDLAYTLNARIDLRQVGSRDAAQLTGGVGRCGRQLCCLSFLPVLEPISLRTLDSRSAAMPATGVCGRLLCCLRYEDSPMCDASSCPVAENLKS